MQQFLLIRFRNSYHSFFFPEHEKFRWAYRKLEFPIVIWLCRDIFYFERRAKIQIKKEHETRDLRRFRKWQFNLLHTMEFYELHKWHSAVRKLK
jgi:hypothetical protein